MMLRQLFLIVALATPAPAADAEYAKEISVWREKRESRLKADNGWLTLAGRYPLKDGTNTFGTGKDNDIVFPAELKDVGPARLGTVVVDAKAKAVTLKLPAGSEWAAGDKTFTGERVLGTATDKRDWVGVGRMRFHIIARDGKYILRLADNESKVRKNFPGCLWYAADAKYKVEAKFVPYPAGKTIAVVNVLDESSQQPCPGYAEFQLNGETFQLDAIEEGEGLFFVFKDATASDTTYSIARFLDVEKRPKDNSSFTLDFNKGYNPPCAFSDFTTCPRAPRQNVLKVRIEAGEKYRERH
jgi:uncharacterized protein